MTKVAVLCESSDKCVTICQGHVMKVMNDSSHDQRQSVPDRSACGPRRRSRDPRHLAPRVPTLRLRGLPNSQPNRDNQRYAGVLADGLRSEAQPERSRITPGVAALQRTRSCFSKLHDAERRPASHRAPKHEEECVILAWSDLRATTEITGVHGRNPTVGIRSAGERRERASGCERRERNVRKNGVRQTVLRPRTLTTSER